MNGGDLSEQETFTAPLESLDVKRGHFSTVNILHRVISGLETGSYTMPLNNTAPLLPQSEMGQASVSPGQSHPDKSKLLCGTSLPAPLAFSGSSRNSGVIWLGLCEGALQPVWLYKPLESP